MPLSSTAKAKLFKAASTEGERLASRKPVWNGPEIDGVTQSLLGRFLADRERFRLLVVEGLKEKDRFSHRLEYGNLWHVCEEATAQKKPWQLALQEYAKGLVEKYRESGQEIDKWYRICKIQFPIYLRFWSAHSDVKRRTPIFQEHSFKTRYKLPSGRVVILRGKYDAVDLVEEPPVGIYLQENKSKGEIIQAQLRSQLTYDLQSMTYLTALYNEPLPAKFQRHPINGFRYNVIRRPLSGREFNIVQLKGRGKEKKGAETDDMFYSRLAKLIEANAGYVSQGDNSPKFFMRWRVEVTKAELLAFQLQSLNPILEQLCDWWEWIERNPFDPWTPRDRDNVDGVGWDRNSVHYRYPYGVYNPAAEGRQGEYDDYLATGNLRFLDRVDNLFPELAL